MYHGSYEAAAEGEAIPSIDMQPLIRIEGNDIDWVEGVLATDDGEILLYGWTNSTSWAKLQSAKTFVSGSNAMAVMLSPEGKVRWLVTDGSTDIDLMHSFEGAAIIDDRIVLCHQKMMDDTWEDAYGITVMDNSGNILRRYDFEDSLIVQNTFAADDALLLCGYYIEGEYRVPFIYAIASSGDLLWEYTDEPVSWVDGKNQTCSFERVAANNQGIVVGVLEHGKREVQLVTLDSTGKKIDYRTEQGFTYNTVRVFEEYYSLSGSHMSSFITYYTNFATHSTVKTVDSLPLECRITLPLVSDKGIYYLVEMDMGSTGVYYADKKRRIVINNPFDHIVYTGGLVTGDDDTLILYGYTYDESHPEKTPIIVTEGHLPME